MDDSLRRKLEQTQLTTEDVLAILEWQLSLPAEEMDCDLISECDLFLAPQTSDADEAQLRKLLVRIQAQISAGHPPAARANASPAPARTAHRRRRPGRLLTAVLIALLLLALAMGAVAFGVHRGVLTFNEDWGWLTPLVYLDGAQEFVSSGELAHVELEHVTIDVLEAVTDGAELRVVYSVTNNEGIAFEAESGTDYADIPGAKEDDVHICDFILVNGQDAYFDDAWQAPGEAPGQMMYYLQTNLPTWGVEIGDAQELTLALPMIGRVEYIDGAYTDKGFVKFTIPAKLPEDKILSAELVDARMDGHAVTIAEAVFSPLNGYVQLHVEGLTHTEFLRDFTTMGEVYGPDDYALDGADLYGTDETPTGLLVGFTMYPPVDGWPDTLVLAMERNGYAPDWEATIRLTNPGE